MKKLLIILIALLLVTGTVHAAQVIFGDYYIDNVAGNDGDTLTTTILTNSTRGAQFTWTLTANALTSSFVQASSTALSRFSISPFSVASTLYTPATTTNIMRFRNDITNNYAQYSFNTSGCGACKVNVSLGVFMTFGAYGAGGVAIDMINIQNFSGRYCILQTNGTFNLLVHSQNEAGTPVGGTLISVLANKTYYVTMQSRRLNVCQMHLYDPSTNSDPRKWTLLGTSEVPMTSNSLIHDIQIGRVDVHAGTQPTAGQYVTYSGLIVDYTNARFPLLPDPKYTGSMFSGGVKLLGGLKLKGN